MPRITKFTITFLLLLILTACTAAPTPTATPAPTQISMATFTSTTTPTRIPSSTPIPTATIIPTLAPEELYSLVGELLENNGGCDLPCWWGITPGETRWEDIEDFVALFGKISEWDYSNSGRKQYSSIIPVSSDISRTERIYQDITVEKGLVVEIEIYYFSSPFYDLPVFLEMYGKPDEVWILSYSHYLGGPPPFDLNLYYPAKGIFASYYPKEGSSEYTAYSINACVDIGPSMILWDPDVVMSFEVFDERYRLAYGKYDKPIATIEDATGMTIDVFYEVYRNPDHESCFQSPRYFWPEP